MNDEQQNEAKNPEEQEEQAEQDNRPPKSKASRARNQTVMLTPEMTGQVRALLDSEEDVHKPDPLADLLPPMSGEFSAGRRSGSGQRPVADYGSDIPSETDLVTQSERKSTGKILGSGASVSRPQLIAGAKAGPALSVSPSAPAPRNDFGGSGSSKVQVRAKAKTKIVGFLVSFDSDSNGEVFEIRAGRFLLTSRPTDHGDFILINDETISPLHAILRATKNGQVQILDQLSEHGTGITRFGTEEEEDVAGSMVTAEHGDLVRFGKRYFVICLVPDVKTPQEEEDDEEE